MTTAALRSTGAQSDSWLLTCLEQVLRPIIRLFLSRRATFQAFTEVAKRIYIDLAREDAAKKNPRQTVTVSEIAFATGIDVISVSRYLQSKPEDSSLSLSPEATILEQWATNATYQDDNGKPLELPVRGSGHSFATLVRRTLRNVSYGPVLDTLINNGNVKTVDNGRNVALVSRWYAQNLGKAGRIKEVMEAACRCLDHFLSTINWNISRVTQGRSRTLYQQERYTVKLSPSKALEFNEACTNLLKQQAEQAVDLIEPLEDTVRTDEHIIAGIGYYHFQIPQVT